jgi:hypothetical protein
MADILLKRHDKKAFIFDAIDAFLLNKKIKR